MKWLDQREINEQEAITKGTSFTKDGKKWQVTCLSLLDFVTLSERFLILTKLKGLYHSKLTI